MVYYVDKIQELEGEVARIRSLRSSDKLKDKVIGEEDENDPKKAEEHSEETTTKSKCMGEMVSAVVSREKEDLDEIILTKTRLDKGIQVVMDVPVALPPPPKTVSKGIQVGEKVAPSVPSGPQSSLAPPSPGLLVYCLPPPSGPSSSAPG